MGLKCWMKQGLLNVCSNRRWKITRKSTSKKPRWQKFNLKVFARGKKQIKFYANVKPSIGLQWFFPLLNSIQQHARINSGKLYFPNMEIKTSHRIRFVKKTTRYIANPTWWEWKGSVFPLIRVQTVTSIHYSNEMYTTRKKYPSNYLFVSTITPINLQKKTKLNLY